MFARLNKVWKNKQLTIQTKTKLRKLYEVFAVSDNYGAECWTLRKVDEHRILTAEMGRQRKKNRKKNNDIRLELNQIDTLVQKITAGYSGSVM